MLQSRLAIAKISFIHKNKSHVGIQNRNEELLRFFAFCINVLPFPRKKKAKTGFMASILGK